MQTRVKAWMAEGGVPVTHETVQGALSAITFIANEQLEGRDVDLAAVLRGFAEQEGQAVDAARAVG